MLTTDNETTHIEQVAERIRMLHKEARGDLPYDGDTSLDSLRPVGRSHSDGGQIKSPRINSEQVAEAFPEGPKVAFIALIATGIKLAEEREKSRLLERDLTVARRSIEEFQAAAVQSRQAAETSLAETRQALEKERQTRGLVGRDLANARRSIGELQAKVEPAAAEQAAAAQPEEWRQLGFRQSRFSFEVPPGFGLAQNAEDGQGATFGRKDGASLAVWGADLAKPKFRAEIDRQMQQDEANGWQLTYRRVTPNWASYSGIKGGKIRYFRAIALCGSKAAAFRLDYDRKKKIDFDPIVARMVRTLKAEGC